MGHHPVSLVAFDGESLPGIILRLAAARQWNAGRLAGSIGLRQPGSSVTALDLRGLSELSGISADVLGCLAYRPGNRFGHNQFRGREFHRELIDLGRRRICPECLCVAPFHRALWDFALLTACPSHAVRLLHSCPRCSRNIDWDHPDLVRCRCGEPLAARNSPAVASSEDDAARAIAALIHDGTLPGVSPALASIGPSDLVRFAMCLGMFVTGWTQNRRVETLVTAGPDAIAMVMRVGIDVVRNWPNGIFDYLHRQQQTSGQRDGRFGAKKAFGDFYDWASWLTEGPVRDAVIAAIKQFVDGDPLLARRVHRSRLLATKEAPTNQSLALVDASRMLGVATSTVKRLITEGTLSSPDRDERGVPMALVRDEVVALAEVLSSSLNLMETAKLLAISKARVLRLVDAGYIIPIHRAALGGRAQWSFARSVLDEFLARFVAVSSEGDDPIGFENTARALLLRSIDIQTLVAMALDGRLPIVSIDVGRTGLKRLMFEAARVHAVCRQAERSSMASVTVAAERLGIKREVVAHLVERGLLPTEAGGGIPEGAISEFSARYVTGAELARVRGTSPRSLAHLLKSAGISPVIGPDVDGARQNIFERNEISRS